MADPWDKDITPLEPFSPATPVTSATSTVPVLLDEGSNTGVPRQRSETSSSTRQSLDRFPGVGEGEKANNRFPDVGFDVIVQDDDVLNQGDRDAGPAGIIRSVQTKLNALGLNVGDVDGVIGRKTSRAIQEAQGKLGLPRTGVLDKKTRLGLTTLSPDQIKFFKNNPESEAGYQNLGENVPVTPSGAVETSPRPKLRLAPNVDITQVEAAETTEEVIAAVAESVPAELSQNPVQYIVDNNLRGLDERNSLGAEAIRGFFRTATPSVAGSFDENDAWCAVFVDSVLRGIGAEPMDPTSGPKARAKASQVAYGPMRALEYQNYGTGVDLEDAKAGDLIILSSSHIGFYTGERDERGKYLVLGGNQSSGGDGRSREDLSQLVAGVVGQESLTTEQLQQIVGVTVDGAYGPATERNVRQYLRTKGIDNYAGGGPRGVSVNVSPYSANNIGFVRRIENIQDLPVDVMKEVTASITGNAAGTR